MSRVICSTCGEAHEVLDGAMGPVACIAVYVDADQDQDLVEVDGVVYSLQFERDRASFRAIQDCPLGERQS